MKHIPYYILTACILLFASSCTKVVDLKLNDESGKLVIEGNITNGTGPQIFKLSTNVPFTNTNTYPAVSGATITVTDQAGNSYLFVEGVAGTYTNTQLTGIPGNTYTMTALIKEITYTAVSTMPQVVTLDSLSSKNQAISTGDNPKKQVTAYYRDPAGLANQYRFVEYVNGVQVKDVFATNDQFNDGLATNMVLRGGDGDENAIHAGDTVTVEMQCIDHPMYLYWLTLSQQSQVGPGGSVTPSDPPTNITPVTLGYFSAHTTQTKTIVAR
ncbi:protein of unknown function [Mucilaginibacter gossypiicola]|uniref:DUF4249 domain-containing protein n=1 Tax=Mucilaginibacter gossypiicola TaxID=551995 RepID=A0A1H8BFH9_9SPHI|nr:DUF4249 domain-containing protein [Mucilaginibacter gossypiicola]SEM81229.1 protein of unknown function [Mucilaginibacter gossypiicola]